MRAGVLALLLLGCAASRPEGVSRANHAPVDGIELAAPGRYATLLHTTSEGGCSVSSFSGLVSSSVVLSLDRDGRARACRGRYSYSAIWANDGQGKPDVSEIVEQQGLSGDWRRKDSWLIVTLGLDDAVCPAVRRGDREKAKPWTLQCFRLDPKGPSHARANSLGLETPPVPVLACFHDELGWPHDVGYVLEQPFGARADSGWDLERRGGWFMLGPGNGVRIEEIAVGGLDPAPMRKWNASATPIAGTDWSVGTPARNAQ
jgi:hypothetical protein